MIPQRTARIEELLKREISIIIQQKLQDPRIGFATITKVDVTPDLKQAVCWISVLETGPKTKETSLNALTGARNKIQENLSHRIRLRYLPKLQFRLDDSIQYGAHIDEVIEKLKKEEGRIKDEQDNF